MQEEGYIQLTMEEAAELCNDLNRFIKSEAVRRQTLLKDQLEQLKINERTVMHEVTELPPALMTGPRLVVEAVSQLCPKTSKKTETGDE